MKNKYALFIGSGVGLVVLFSIFTYLYQESRKEALSFLAKENAEVFVRDYSPKYGEKNAKVFLTEFLDPECESCRQLYPEVKAILEEFKGKVQLVVRYAPFHGNSVTAIKALEAARMQGKYWEALELLFHYQPMWGSHHAPKPELIFEYLPKLGLDMEKLSQDMLNPALEKNIQQDVSRPTITKCSRNS